MRRAQKIFASGVIAALVAGSIVPSITRVEVWPFLSYPMYSFAMTPGRLLTVRLYGVPQNSELSPFHLVNPEQIHPFNNPRLTAAIGLTMQRGKERAAEALQFVLENYEARRRAGLHDGPPLRSIAIQGFAWDLHPTESNANPVEKTPLLEISIDENRT